MTEITNPLPDDPGGASAPDGESLTGDGSQQLQTSSSRGETAASSELPAAREGR